LRERGGRARPAPQERSRRDPEISSNPLLTPQEMTLQHIIADTDILMDEVEAYSNLPDDLKDEIRKLLSCLDPLLALRHSNLTHVLQEGETQVTLVGAM
jgi:hypothetical protein